MKKFFITGSAGFIGFHLAKKLLDLDCSVLGYDSVNNYYDQKLKESRLEILNSYSKFTFEKNKLENYPALKESIHKFDPDVIFHFAAQAGVRYSLINPKSYIDSNIIGTFNLLESIRDLNYEHLFFSSTSSIYGDNKKIPFSETDSTDNQLSFYAHTKQVNENMISYYAKLYKTPMTSLRLFTVYGPWGRPDHAIFSFTENVLKRQYINVFNNGESTRDFTYIDDLVDAIVSMLDKEQIYTHKILHKKFNIGSEKPIKILDFIKIIEDKLNLKAKKNYMPLQEGDMLNTFSDSTAIRRIIGDFAKTNLNDGISEFAEWYKSFYRNK